MPVNVLWMRSGEGFAAALASNWGYAKESGVIPAEVIIAVRISDPEGSIYED